MTDHLEVTLTQGHVLRHAPAKGAQGYEAALVDIAQDLVLHELHREGSIDNLAFKGGTALRKLYAGESGRFSTDLDFAVRDVNEETSPVMELLVEGIEKVQVGPFRFGTTARRGKSYLTIDSSLGDILSFTCKLDVSPPPWLPTEQRAWIPMPIHDHYGAPLPRLHVVQIEENVAEKIARLNRASPARDAYDLVWIMRNRRNLGRTLDLELIRRLAVMKIWVDMNGLQSSLHTWKKGHEPAPFDVERWLRQRTIGEFDDDNIGLLATPVLSLDELGETLSREYGFLRELLPDEQVLTRCNGGDRSLLLRALADLPGSQMLQGTCW